MIPHIVELDFPLAGCGGIFQAPNGEIHSPNYPNPFMNNIACFWTIRVEKNHRILLNFTDFDLEAQDSCVMVSDTDFTNCLLSNMDENLPNENI